MPRESDLPAELLLVITSERADQVFEHVLSRFEVTQRVSARVALLRPTSPRAMQVSVPEGAQIFSTPDISNQIVDSLTPQESLFVAAWRMRVGQEKRREHEGLDWDTPGFQPPR